MAVVHADGVRCDDERCAKVPGRLGQLGIDATDPRAQWFVRAVHLRFVDDAAAGIFAETCPGCLGVVDASLPGTRTRPAQRGSDGRYMPGSRLTYTDCECSRGASEGEILAEHELTEFFSRRSEPSTGTSRD